MVALDSGVEAGGDEGGGVAEEVDVLVDLLDDLEGEFRNQRPVGDEEDGDFFVAVAYAADDIEGGAFFELGVAFEVPVEQDGGVGGVGGNERKAVLGGGGADDLVAFVSDSLDKAFHGAVGDGVGTADLAGDQENPTLFAHGTSQIGKQVMVPRNGCGCVTGAVGGGMHLRGVWAMRLKLGVDFCGFWKGCRGRERGYTS